VLANVDHQGDMVVRLAHSYVIKVDSDALLAVDQNCDQTPEPLQPRGSGKITDRPPDKVVADRFGAIGNLCLHLARNATLPEASVEPHAVFLPTITDQTVTSIKTLSRCLKLLTGTIWGFSLCQA
jgi:hypothetical protein